MKILIFVIFSALSFFTWSSGLVLPKASKSFCVQTLNTFGVFYSDNLEERHKNTLLFLEENPCDIVLLQEVLKEEHHDNLKKLAEKLSMEIVSFKISNTDQKNSGLVSLVKGRAENRQTFYFPNNLFNGGFIEEMLQDISLVIDKGFGSVKFKDNSFRDDQTLLVINTHLDHLSQAKRVHQLLLYFKWMIDHSYYNFPIILAGDFNFSSDSLEFDIVKHILQFQDPYEQIKKQRSCTHACSDSDYSFLNLLAGEGIKDHIFFKPAKKLEFDFHNIDVFPKQYKGKDLSDHYGVRAFFTTRETLTSSRKTPDEERQKKIKKFKDTLEQATALLAEGEEWEDFFHNINPSSLNL